MPKPQPALAKGKGIFVSYCHADVAGARELMKWLRPICQRLPGSNLAWIDHEQLLAGDSWKTTLLDALESANVFIVLMSIDYVASTFCMNEELSRILRKRAAFQGITVIAVAYRSARLQDFLVCLPDKPEEPVGLWQVQCIPQHNVSESGGDRLGLRSLDSWPLHQRDAAWMLLASQMEEALIDRTGHLVRWKNSASGTGLTRSSEIEPTRALQIRADWLPYLADRQDQSLALTAALKHWRDNLYRRPLLLLTEGRNEDCPAKWVERLHQHEFSRALCSILPGFGFGHSKFVPWPNAAGRQGTVQEAAEAFVPAFAAALNVPTTTDADALFDGYATRSRPAFLWLSCHDDGDERTAKRALDGLLNLLARYPNANARNMLVVSINLVRPSDSNPRARAVLSRLFERLIRRAHKSEIISCALLGSLPELDEMEIAGWSHEHARNQLIDDIEMLCPEQLPATLTGTWPMRTFARVARNWLAPR